MGVKGTNEEALGSTEISTKNSSRVGRVWGRQPEVKQPRSPLTSEPRRRQLVAVPRCQDKVGPMNSEQLQGLAVLALAMVPVALLWWVWIRMLD